MKRIMIAGGAGFIGSHLAELLISSGNEIVVVDNLSSGLESNLSSIRDKIEFIKSDISEIDYREHIDVLINLASRASRVEWETYPVDVALTNSLGNDHLIRTALKDKALYIYASSSEIYGNSEIIPTPETYIGKVNTIGSRSSYDEGKRFGEALVKSYERQYGLKSIVIRFFNTFGPRMRGGDFYGRVIDRFIDQALSNGPVTVYGDGGQTRSFTYVSDTVNAIKLLLEKGTINDVYNVGNSSETRIIDLAKMVIEICSSRSEIAYLPLPEGEPRRRSADIGKIRKLGFRHQVDLRVGIKKTADYKHNM
ncbi:MAG: NAD-dependent epimerase/dehydratase family protein [Thermoplasmatales archaeon]